MPRERDEKSQISHIIRSMLSTFVGIDPRLDSGMPLPAVGSSDYENVPGIGPPPSEYERYVTGKKPFFSNIDYILPKVLSNSSQCLPSS